MIEGLEQKNISLDKGIVRTPSIGADGELSECVNLIPHKGEMVRIPEPQPLTEDVRGKYIYYTYDLVMESLEYNLSVLVSEPFNAPVEVEVKYRIKPDIGADIHLTEGVAYEGVCTDDTLTSVIFSAINAYPHTFSEYIPNTGEGLGWAIRLSKKIALPANSHLFISAKGLANDIKAGCILLPPGRVIADYPDGIKMVEYTPGEEMKDELPVCISFHETSGNVYSAYEAEAYPFIENKGVEAEYTSLNEEDLRTPVGIKIESECARVVRGTLHTGIDMLKLQIPNLASEEELISVELYGEGVAALYLESNKRLKAFKIFGHQESDNRYLPDDDEQAKMPIEIEEDSRLVLLHDCENTRNIVIQKKGELKYYRGSDYKVICNTGEDIADIMSVGNVLIVTQNNTKRYFVWSDGKYKEQNLLGLMPKVNFTLGDTIKIKFNVSKHETYNGSLLSWGYNPGNSNGCFLTLDWSEDSLPNPDGDIILRGQYAYDATPEDKVASNNAVYQGLYAYYSSVLKSHREEGMHCFPFFLRWGVKLYDGSVINLSAPIMMMPSSIIRPSFGVHCSELTINSLGIWGINTAVLFNPRYLYGAIDAEVLRDVSEDLVAGIVVYMTPEIEVMDPEPALETVGVTDPDAIYVWKPLSHPIQDALGFTPTDLVNATNGTKKYNITHTWTPRAKKSLSESLFTGDEPYYEMAFIPTSELKKSNYKLFFSCSDGTIQDYKEALGDTHDASNYVKNTDREYTRLQEQGYASYQIPKAVLSGLSSQTPLANVVLQQTNKSLTFHDVAYVYNMRVYYANIGLTLPRLIGSQLLSDSRSFDLREVQDKSAKTKIFVHMPEGYMTLMSDVCGFRGDTPFIAVQYKSASEIGFESASFLKGISLYKDASKDYAYWSDITSGWAKDNVDLAPMFMSCREGIDVSNDWLSDNYFSPGNTILRKNVITYTKVGNPWVLEREIELPCEQIYALSSTTEAVSTGQFGDYPLYAFTEGGIFALSINETGEIRAQQAISREVITENGRLLQLDNAIVFATKAGLRLLAAPPCEDISNQIEGANKDENLFNGSQSISDIAPFNTQILNAQMIYDYANKKLHLFYDGNLSEAVKIKSYKEEDTPHLFTKYQLDNPSKGIGLEGQISYEEEDEGGKYGYVGIVKWVLDDNPTEGRTYFSPLVELKKGDTIIIKEWTEGTKTTTITPYIWDDITVDVQIGDNIDCYYSNEITAEYTATQNCTLMWHDARPLDWYIRCATVEYSAKMCVPSTEEVYRQKHYVYDLESGQWATQILDRQLTTCVAGYPFSTMQFGRQLMQYNNELEADTVKQGWLLTRPITFGDPFTRKMLWDLRVIGQKTHQKTKFKVQVYISEDRVNWHRLTSLKGRSAKWYRFLIKADMCGLDTLTGITCQYVPRLGNKLR